MLEFAGSGLGNRVGQSSRSSASDRNAHREARSDSGTMSPTKWRRLRQARWSDFRRSSAELVQYFLELVAQLAQRSEIQFRRIVDFQERASEPASIRLKMQSDIIVQFLFLEKFFIDLDGVFPGLGGPSFIRLQFRQPIDASSHRKPFVGYPSRIILKTEILADERHLILSVLPHLALERTRKNGGCNIAYGLHQFLEFLAVLHFLKSRRQF